MDFPFASEYEPIADIENGKVHDASVPLLPDAGSQIVGKPLHATCYCTWFSLGE
jgi:hypothetical protein